MNAPEPVSDLVDALERIEEEARRARQAFAAGELMNGSTPLRRIELLSGDALARAGADFEDEERIDRSAEGVAYP